MPVRSASRCCISMRKSLPPRDMRRSSSSSGEKPSAITPPLFTSCGGSGCISLAMRSRTLSQGFRRSPMLASASLPVSRHAFFSGAMASRALRSCTISRGETRPTATFDVMRSMSPMRWSSSSVVLRNEGERKKCSTTSRRRSIVVASSSGNTIHRFSMRPPMGVMVRSITSRSDAPSLCIACVSSSERMVKLSRRT